MKMILDEYEKIREEKRKALLVMKTELRKVDFDKEFESMQQLSIKKGNDEIFNKLATGKDASKRKENVDQEERGRWVSYPCLYVYSIFDGSSTSGLFNLVGFSLPMN